MFRAIGFVIILWYISSLFSQTFSSADSALSASFGLLEATATASQQRFVY
ncbi:hypothetical protein IPH92_01555 [Candidatus Kaiserbacteria bacterium]|nr:MAG: hypothetical protein IPH92_01555 [Candidatus Kaiserbacteria bacterium]